MTTGNAGDFSFSLSIDQRAATRDFEAFKAKTTGGLKDIDAATKPAAKALGAVSGALGSVGGSAATVTRGLGDIAGLLATGGGLTFAITGATLLIAKLSEAFIEARESAKTFGLSVDASITARASSRAASLEELRKAVSGVEKQLRNFGKTSEQVISDDLAGRVAAGEKAEASIRARLATAEKDAARAATFARTLRSDEVQDKARETKALVDVLSAQLDDVRKDTAASRVELDRLRALAGQLDGLRGSTPTASKPSAGPRIDPAEEERKRNAALIAEAQAFDTRLAQEESKMDAAREEELWRATQERIDLARMEAEEKGRIADEYNAAQREEQKKITDFHKAQHQATLNAMMEATVVASSAAANAGLVFVDALFESDRMQKAAAEKLANDLNNIDKSRTGSIQEQQQKRGDAEAAYNAEMRRIEEERIGAALLAMADMVARQAGSFTIGKGIEAMASGVALLANPATAALSPGAFALGGTLLAAGVALGGVVPGAIGMLTGGGGGGDVATAPRSDMGVNAPRASQGGDDKGSGQTVINISYGVSGPRGDETAALVAQSLQTARRRGRM